MKNSTRKLLIKCGIPPHIMGYHYLGTAIEAVIEKPELICNNVTKVLYPNLAKIHNSTPSRVERAIRRAIEISFDRIDMDVADELFGWSVDVRRGKPTNSHFIAALAEVLKNEENN